MASITGSTTIDWSGVSLDPINVQQAFNEFSSRFNQVALKLSNHEYFLNGPPDLPPPTSTFLSITTLSGEIVTVTGSGLDLNNPASNPVVKTFEYINPSPSEVVRLVGTLDFVGNEVVNSLTIGFPGSQQTIIGNIVVSPSGNVSGSITQLQVTFGSTEMTLKGSLVLSGNFDISGTVTQISVLSGTSTIVMSGLSLPYHALDSVTTANDLFSVVGNLMPGNDTITYTNNSGVGMTFSGGAGKDTIAISGPNGDTLNGGAGIDTLNGGAGVDVMNGGLGNDIILIGAAADHGANEVINGGVGLDVIRFTSTSGGETLVVATGVTAVEQVVIGTAAGLTTGTTALNVNAANVATGLSITGNAGDNVLTGTGANDTLAGGAGHDTLDGGAGTNTLVGGTGNDRYIVNAATNVVTEGLNAGIDTVAASVNYTLTANVEQLELTGGALTGTGNALANTLTGTTGNNTLTGLAGADQLIGGAGSDILNGGAGADIVQGGADDDLILLRSVAEYGLGEIIDGGGHGPAGDTLRMTAAVAGTLTLTTNMTNIEQVQIANAAGLTTGLAAININAAAVANGLTILGNNGANQITGTSQADTLTGNGGNDTLRGGGGADTVVGGDGNDVFLLAVGESGAGESLIGGAGTDALRVIATSGSVVLAGSVDVESVAIATAAGVTTGTTAVNLDASTVTNVLTIIGNNGANQITGTAFGDTLTGNLGIDTLNGGAGNDVLNGGAGADNLQGGADDDLILLGSVAEFAAGEIIDGGGHGLAGDTLRMTAAVAGTLTLTANVTNIEQVQIANAAGLTTGLAAININATAVANGLTILGNNGANRITGTSQADTLTGNGGADTLNGQAGDDALNGGTGNDIVLIGAAADHGAGEAINGGAGVDVLRFTSTTEGETLVLNDTVTELEQVVISTAAGLTTGITALNVDASKIGTGLTLTGNAGANQLTGTSGNDLLNGGVGADILAGGAGNDTLMGGTGNDTIHFGAGDGQDTVQDNSGTADRVQFDIGLDPQDLVISRQADNLRLAIHGSPDQITVQNWYDGTANRTETIQAGNGDILLSTKVDVLIQAMAAFTLDTGLTWEDASGGAGLPAEQAQFNNILAANWQP